MELMIDLNADVGESVGIHRYGDDEGVMPFISSANIACGFHAGDPGVMRATVALALAHGVKVGAHPGLADLVGFGRREMQVSPREVEDLVAYQVGALAGIATGQGVALAHVKPHGALYNMAARDRALADAVVRGVRSVDAGLAVFGLSGSKLVDAATHAGLRAVSEAFADRGYGADGRLAPRGVPGGVVSSVADVLSRAVEMVRHKRVTALDGYVVPVAVDTLCIHGDTPGAAEMARLVRGALEADGVRVRPATSRL